MQLARPNAFRRRCTFVPFRRPHDDAPPAPASLPTLDDDDLELADILTHDLTSQEEDRAGTVEEATVPTLAAAAAAATTLEDDADPLPSSSSDQTVLDRYFDMKGTWFRPLEMAPIVSAAENDRDGAAPPADAAPVPGGRGRTEEFEAALGMTGKELRAFRAHCTARPESFMRASFRPKSHQYEAVCFCLARCRSDAPAFLIADDTGTGKTALSLCLLNALERIEAPPGDASRRRGRALVVGTAAAVETYRLQMRAHCVCEDDADGGGEGQEEDEEDPIDLEEETIAPPVGFSVRKRGRKPSRVGVRVPDVAPRRGSGRGKGKGKARKRRRANDDDEGDGDDGGPARRPVRTLFVTEARKKVDWKEVASVDLVLVTYSVLGAALRRLLANGPEADGASKDPEAEAKRREEFVTAFARRPSARRAGTTLAEAWAEEFRDKRGERAFDRDPTLALFFSTRWETVILDEAHAIHNDGTYRNEAVKCLSAERRGAMTATPSQNNNADLVEINLFLKVPELDEVRRASDVRRALSEQQGAAAEAASALMDTLADKYMIRRLKSDLAARDSGMRMPVLRHWVYTRDRDPGELGFDSEKEAMLYRFLTRDVDTLELDLDAHRRGTKDMTKEQKREDAKRRLGSHLRRLEENGARLARRGLRGLVGRGKGKEGADDVDSDDDDGDGDLIDDELRVAAEQLNRRAIDAARDAHSIKTLFDNHVLRLQQCLSVPKVLMPGVLTDPCYGTHCTKANMLIEFLRSRLDRGEGYDPRLCATNEDGTELDAGAEAEYREKASRKRFKVIVYFVLVETMRTIAERLRLEYIDHLLVEGRTSMRDRREAVAAFRRPDGPCVMLASINCMGESWDGTSANRSVVMEIHFNPAKFKQGPQGRICRVGADPNFECHVTQMLVRGTREENFHRMLQHKESDVRAVDTRLWRNAGACGINSSSRAVTTRDELLGRFDRDSELEQLRAETRDYLDALGRSTPLESREATRSRASASSVALASGRNATIASLFARAGSPIGEDPFDQFPCVDDPERRRPSEKEGRADPDSATAASGEDPAPKERGGTLDQELEHLAVSREIVDLRRRLKEAKAEHAVALRSVLQAVDVAARRLEAAGRARTVERPVDDLFRYAIEVRAPAPRFREDGVRGTWLFSESPLLAVDTPSFLPISRAAKARLRTPSRRPLRLLDLSSHEDGGLEAFEDLCREALASDAAGVRVLTARQREAYLRLSENPNKPCSAWAWVAEAWRRDLERSPRARLPSSSSSSSSSGVRIRPMDSPGSGETLRNLTHLSACCAQLPDAGSDVLPRDGILLRLRTRDDWVAAIYLFRPQRHAEIREGLPLSYPSRTPKVLAYYSDPTEPMIEPIETTRGPA